jgi:hypothetical protein
VRFPAGSADAVDAAVRAGSPGGVGTGPGWQARCRSQPDVVQSVGDLAGVNGGMGNQMPGTAGSSEAPGLLVEPGQDRVVAYADSGDLYSLAIVRCRGHGESEDGDGDEFGSAEESESELRAPGRGVMAVVFGQELARAGQGNDHRGRTVVSTGAVYAVAIPTRGPALPACGESGSGPGLAAEVRGGLVRVCWGGFGGWNSGVARRCHREIPFYCGSATPFPESSQKGLRVATFRHQKIGFFAVNRTG